MIGQNYEVTSMDIICAWCTLKKEVNTYGVAVWPESWVPERLYIDRESQEYKQASHGICTECYYKIKGEQFNEKI